MSSAIKKILNSAQTDSRWHTHTSMVPFHGKYMIQRDMTDIFWHEYSKYIYKEQDPMIGINEVVKPFTPLRVDVDIKVKELDDSDLAEHVYSEKHLLGVIQVFQRIIREVVDDFKKEFLYCFILEKDAYRVETSECNYIKNGFHLHFPWLFMNKDEIETHIFPRAKKAINEMKLFGDLGFEDCDKLVDTKASCGNWLLYKSKKSEEMTAYQLTRIVDENCDDMFIEDALRGYKIYDEQEKEIEIEDNEAFFLPQILSILPAGREAAQMKQNLVSVVRRSVKRKVQSATYDEVEVSKKLQDMSDLLQMLSDERAEDYQTWTQVMFIIYNETEGSEEGLNLFLKFSSRCAEKFDEAHCVNSWENNTTSHANALRIGSLYHYAKIDNPQEFRKWCDARSKSHIDDTLASGGGHNDVAKALFEIYGDVFVCSSVVTNTWYEFSGHKWSEVEEGISLREKISSTLVEKLNTYLKSTSDQLSKTSDDIEKARFSVRIKSLTKLMNNCKSAPFKSNIMKECREVFYNKEFAKRLNRDKFKICCANGVYDIKNKVFRAGLPDDYFSIAMPVNYIEFEEHDQRVQAVYRFFEKIFPDKSIRDYFYDITYDIFTGGNYQKKLYCWSGVGNNGKTVTQNLIERMLGQYANKLPTSLIVGKRTQSSAASPEVARVSDSRFCVLQEPDQSDTMNIGILKELTGNDTFFARGLYSTGREIEPLFKLVLICNEPPKIPNGDQAAWNRIRVVPFESTFCEDAPESFEEQLLQKRFPVDKQFDSKIADMLEPLLWALIHHGKKGAPHIEPAKVKIATEMLKRDNDNYKQFAESMIVQDEKSSMTLTETYSLFKTWYKDANPNRPMVTKVDFEKSFKKLYGDLSPGSRWKGIRPRGPQDDASAEADAEEEEEDLM
jgi:P4 family phage/plasmid primase-like protien